MDPATALRQHASIPIAAARQELLQQPFKIVVVDDDPSILALMTHLLKQAGLQSVTCSNGADALELLDREDWDLLLLDWELPDMEGVEICRRIKSDVRHDARQIIMVTGRSSIDDKVSGFAVGADDYITKPFQPLELLARVRAARRVIELQKELLAMSRKLQELSVTDGLTGVFNRRHMGSTLDRIFEHSVRYGRPLSVTLVDVDRFKSINDTLGHQAGDRVLTELARRFSSSVRSSDYVARYGGEEFVVVLPETQLEEAVSFGEKLRQNIEGQPIATGDGEIAVTVSVGTASLPHTSFNSPAEMIAAADLALYRAKRNGRNRVEAERRRGPRERAASASPPSFAPSSSAAQL